MPRRADQLSDHFDYDPVPETFEETAGCDMCGAHIDDPCECFDPQKERRYRGHIAPELAREDGEA